MLFSQRVKSQKLSDIKLSSAYASTELRTIRDEVEWATFDSVRLKDGFQGTEVQHCLGYLAFMQWLLDVMDGSDPNSYFVSDSVRTHSLKIMGHVAANPGLVSEIRKWEPAFAPKEELELGWAKSSSPLWMKSTTRGVIITGRMLAFSISNHFNIGNMQSPVTPRFAVAFISLGGEKPTAALQEWLIALFGDLGTGF